MKMLIYQGFELISMNMILVSIAVCPPNPIKRRLKNAIKAGLIDNIWPVRFPLSYITKQQVFKSPI